jgi:hypothetical protein
LKRDQRLIIDFVNFSKKFIDLIQLCCQSPNQGPPPAHHHPGHGGSSSSVGSLHNGGHVNMSVSSSSQYFIRMDFTTSVFTIIEMNEFNHVIHLSLQFRPGNDAAIKSYLSSSLRVALMRFENLQQDHESLNEEFANLKRSNREQMTDLRTIRWGPVFSPSSFLSSPSSAQ